MEMDNFILGKINECTHWKLRAVVLGDHDTITDDGEKTFKIENAIVYEKFAGKFISKLYMKYQRAIYLNIRFIA